MIGVRDPSTCPFRIATQGPSGLAFCRLAGELAALGGDGIPVGEDACRACCRRPLPSPTRINPVIASLVDRGLGREDGAPNARRQWVQERLRVALHEDHPLPSLPARSFVPCIHLGDALTEEPVRPTFACRLPGHGTARTTPDDCHRCRHWSDRVRPSPRPIGEWLPRPNHRCGSRVRRWAVGVRTSPRKPSLVDWSLDSLVRAGWPEAMVSSDGPVPLAPRHEHRRMVQRGQPAGSWPNFYLLLVELLMRDPDADAYFLAEDDVLYHDRLNLREYLEGVLWPGDRPGVVSLYCPSAYDRPDDGWHRPPGGWALGSLTLIFPAELARQFVTDPEVLDWRRTGRADGLAGPGVAVGRWASRRGIPVSYPCPSLAQHIGDRSTLWAVAEADEGRRAARFLGDLD